ncbi:unnamed protein product [Lactuca virosa]|uniref:KIB1-4 beta-propeller domain-containing protein n=1 Tax=Lactuca virosa TaxID=75947 RepID=A0AAU9PJ92_9ASTR|nr:unnamed protein product [Lactuca virosa]
MASKPPMKISIEPRDNKEDSYCCLEDFKERRFKTILPHSSDRICFGLTCGYLVLFGRETRDFWLVNPITKHELHFPYYPLYVAARIKKLRTILVFAPSISRWVFVLLHKKISFSLAGIQGWHHVSSTCIRDLQYFKGKIYTLHMDFSLRELRLGLRQKHKWILLKTKNFPNPKLFNPQFVSSGENLYVMSYSGFLPKRVMELDFREMKWVKPDKATYAFFIGNKNYSAAFKLGSWADLQTQHKSSEYVLGDDKSRKCMFFYELMWYFPHDCLNVNRFDE